jgi:hypothetical protein
MWRGYYEQYGTKHDVTFKDFRANPTPGGAIQGEGTDEVGGFHFTGSFNGTATKVRFVKQYTQGANHAIYYEGDVQLNPPVIRGYWGFTQGGKDGQF